MIDPVEFGEMKGVVTALQGQMTDLKAKQASMDTKLDQVLNQLSEAKGGWKVMMMFGGAATTLGAGIAWLAQQLGKH